tara:strand:+ start:243 stop:410 length:168 start_codon:yes stop_codon:yes gene_type:complete
VTAHAVVTAVKTRRNNMEEEKLCGCGVLLGGNQHCDLCKEHNAAPVKKSKKDKKE